MGGQNSVATYTTSPSENKLHGTGPARKFSSSCLQDAQFSYSAGGFPTALGEQRPMYRHMIPILPFLWIESLLVKTPLAIRSPFDPPQSRNSACDENFNHAVMSTAEYILSNRCFEPYLARRKTTSFQSLGGRYGSCAVVGHYNGSISHADAVFGANWHFSGFEVKADTAFFRFTSPHLGFYQTRNETVVTSPGKRISETYPECRLFPCKHAPADPRKAYFFRCRRELEKLWKKVGVVGSPTTGTMLLIMAVRLCKEVNVYGMSFRGEGQKVNADSLENPTRSHHSASELSFRAQLRNCHQLNNADHFR